MFTSAVYTIIGLALLAIYYVLYRHSLKRRILRRRLRGE
jgi:hypothetical protein